MRITNKIMQNNSLYNINNNKIAENDLATQISTGKKINRPSDDPVIAIRALRLRSTVTQLNQYYEKNASDAEKWLKVTEDSLKTITDVLTDAVKQATDGANKDLTLSDCETIITQIDSLTREYYATGNVDYAGRYVFTGFRTETPLTFDDNESAEYKNINDEFNYDDVEKVNRVIGLHKVNAGDTNTGAATDVMEHSISQATVGRIQLSYDTLDASDTTNFTIKYREPMEVPAVATISDSTTKPGAIKAVINMTPVSGSPNEDKTATFNALPTEFNTPVTSEEGYHEVVMNSDYTFTVKQLGGANPQNIIQLNKNGSVHSSYREYEITPNILDENASEAQIDQAYQDCDFETGNQTDNLCYLNSLTGELIMNKKMSDKMTSLVHIDNANTIDIVYNKSQWTSGDLRPENLFDCEYHFTDASGRAQTTHYNGGNGDHAMEYDVGYNQKVRVNTTAEEVFTTDVKRSADDLKNLLSKMKDLTNTMNALKTNKANTNDKDVQQNIQNEIDAAQKAFDYLREDMQDLMGRKITSFQKALDVANVAVTENGTRSKRLDMISTRLMNQVTTFKTLQSENEDIDLAETATMLSTAELTYQASLMATGKISQRSLMDYI